MKHWGAFGQRQEGAIKHKLDVCDAPRKAEWTCGEGVSGRHRDRCLFLQDDVEGVELIRASSRLFSRTENHICQWWEGTTLGM